MPLKNKTIVIVSLMRFDALASTNYTIARYLARNNQVFYVDNPFTLTDWLRLRKTPEYARRKHAFSPFATGLTNAEDKNLKVVIPMPVLPLNFLPEGKLYRSLLKLNEWMVARRIKKVLRKQKAEATVYINSFNFHLPGVGQRLKPKLKVYHCVDPIIVPFDQKHGLVSEKQIVEQSDVVICTSKQLYADKIKLNPQSFFVPNAADSTHSSKALDVALPVHESLRNIPAPVIGYLGAIERRMDYPLLQKVVEINPDKSFVFAGPVDAGFVPDWMKETKNVYLTGKVSYNEMPGVIKGFDVALIPFKKDEVSNTIFPLKLFEYLGAGKPVVATNFNDDLKEFTGDIVAYCKDADAFSAAIEKALQQGPEYLQQRISVAAANTWDKRGEDFSNILEKAL